MNRRMESIFKKILLVSDADLDSMTEREYFSFENAMSCATRKHRQIIARAKAERREIEEREGPPSYDEWVSLLPVDEWLALRAKKQMDIVAAYP